MSSTPPPSSPSSNGGRDPIPESPSPSDEDDEGGDSRPIPTVLQILQEHLRRNPLDSRHQDHQQEEQRPSLLGILYHGDNRGDNPNLDIRTADARDGRHDSGESATDSQNRTPAVDRLSSQQNTTGRDHQQRNQRWQTDHSNNNSNTMERNRHRNREEEEEEESDNDRSSTSERQMSPMRSDDDSDNGDERRRRQRRRRRQSRRQRSRRRIRENRPESAESRATFVANYYLRRMYMLWKHGIGSTWWHWLVILLQTLLITSRLAFSADLDREAARSPLLALLQRWAVILIPCWATLVALSVSLGMWFVRDEFKLYRSFDRDKRRMERLMRRYHEQMRRYRESAELDDDLSSSQQDDDEVVIEMEEMSSSGPFNEREAQPDDSDTENDIQEEDEDDNQRLLESDPLSMGALRSEDDTASTAPRSSPPELPVIVRSSRSLRRRRRKRIDRFYACSFAVGLVIVSATLVPMTLKLDRVVDVPLAVVFAIPMLYAVVQSAAFLVFGAHLWKFVRSPVWTYIYTGLFLLLLSSFSLLLYLNLKVMHTADVVLFAPLIAAMAVIGGWCIRFVFLSIAPFRTDNGGLIRGDRVPLSCELITSNGDGKMSAVSAMWSLNQCTNLNHLTSRKREEFRLRTRADACLTAVQLLPMSLFLIMLSSSIHRWQQMKPSETFILAMPLIFVELSFLIWVAFRDGIVASFLEESSVLLSGVDNNRQAEIHERWHRIFSADQEDAAVRDEDSQDLDDIVTILRAMARGETSNLEAPDGMSREEFIRQGLLQATIRHLNRRRRRLQQGNASESSHHPVHPQLLTMLPTFNYRKEGTSSSVSAESTESCPICLTEYDDGDELRMLPCFHKFHTSCIDTWFSTDDTCPNCKIRVDSQAVMGDELMNTTEDG